MVNSESAQLPDGGLAKNHLSSQQPIVGATHVVPNLLLREPDVAEEPTEVATGTEDDVSTGAEASSLYCSVPLSKVREVLDTYAKRSPPNDKKLTRKFLCLYCDRTFVTTSLRQKHVDRCHSAKKVRRSSSRFQQGSPTSTAATTTCVFCNKFGHDDVGLKELFHHLIGEHSNRYFACVQCEERFIFRSHLDEHNITVHEHTFQRLEDDMKHADADDKPKTNTFLHDLPMDVAESSEKQDKEKTNLIRSKHKTKIKEDEIVERRKDSAGPSLRVNVRKELRKKRAAVRNTKINVRRITRLQAKISMQAKTPRKRTRTTKTSEKASSCSDSTEKPQNCVNPYPSFDAYFRVKKITDHSIDNLKISSLTFDDVFDKAFYNRIRCNIQENLQNHIDGKLFKNEESETRISHFEKMQEATAAPTENFGCDISLNAATPVVSLLSAHYGEDLESQIEYGSKASKKRPPPKKDEVHYKYFTRRKYQASILESKENRDLSKLDMWTQLVVKNRQQSIINAKKSEKEKLEYAKGQEYRTKLQNEELNRILDRRGPFEDLKEEANKKAAMEKLTRLGADVEHETLSDVTFILNDLVGQVFENVEVKIKSETCLNIPSAEDRVSVERDPVLPSYLQLRRSSSMGDIPDVDKSDRITLICSSQETENFDASNVPRDKNALVELTGEWARTRIYVCAACGKKLPNMKLLLEHKSVVHQNAWTQHHELVGNQSELYRHLSIPGLGKVGYVEDFPPVKSWRKSDARRCTKCSRACNSLGELHRHVLECGEDWSWMLARKKMKYRPFGAKSRKKRRGEWILFSIADSLFQIFVFVL